MNSSRRLSRELVSPFEPQEDGIDFDCARRNQESFDFIRPSRRDTSYEVSTGKCDPVKKHKVLWHSDSCFFDVFQWSYAYKIQPADEHKSFAMAALGSIYDILGDKVEQINFLVMKSIGGRLKIAIAGHGFDIYSAKPNDISALLRIALTRIEKDSQISSEAAALTVPDEVNSSAVHLVEIISHDSMAVMADLPNTADSDSKPRLQKLFDKIFKESGAKPLSEVPVSLDFLDEIAEAFPNFGDFCHHLKSQFALARLGDGVVRLRPTLLIGDPGVGKTEILRRISAGLTSEFKSISMSSAQSGSALAGSDIFWSNSRQGVLFDLLAFGKSANPIVMLDELDKATRNSTHSPVGALYDLLERESARVFEDKALPGVLIDASHVVWVATANNEGDIESALLSRFKVFKVQSPSLDQSVAVMRSIYSDMLKSESWGGSFSGELPEDVEAALSFMSPREMRKAIESACANAAISGRSYLIETDIKSASKQRKIGF